MSTDYGPNNNYNVRVTAVTSATLQRGRQCIIKSHFNNSTAHTQRQTDRQTDRQRGRQTDTDRQTDGWTDREADRLTQTDRQTDGQTDRQTDRWTDRRRDRELDTGQATLASQISLLTACHMLSLHYAVLKV